MGEVFNKNMEDHAMKKLLLSFLTVSLAATLLANNRSRSELRVSLYDGSAFSITVGDLMVRNQSTFQVVKNLAPGRHFVEIFKTERARGRSGRWQTNQLVLFADYITIPRASVIVGEINRRGRFVVREEYTMSNHPGNNVSHSHNCGGEWNNGNWGTNENMGMTQQSFARLLNTLKSTSFESNKLEIAIQALTWNWVTSMQVRHLMSVFSFESSKLEIAKFAFKSTADPENYFMVHEGFNFGSSSRELNRYLASTN